MFFLALQLGVPVEAIETMAVERFNEWMAYLRITARESKKP